MKIFETKFLPKISDNNQKPSQKRCFLNKNVCGDSFTRSNSVSFRAKPVPNLKKTAENVLNNPSMMEKFGAFMAAGFATLCAIAGGKDDEKNEDSSINNIVVDILEKMSEEEATSTTIDLPVEEKTEIIPYEVNTVPLEVKENIPTSVELVSVEFPKKKGAGTLSKDYAELKKVVTSLKLEKDLAEKLTEICNELLNNKDETVEKLNLDAKAMKEQLSEQDNLKEFIELNYKKLKAQNAPEVENQESVDTVSQKTATEKPKKDDPINVNKAVRQKRPRINMNYYEGEPEINQKDSNIFEFRIPGTLRDTKSHLKTLLEHFKKNVISNDNSQLGPRFMCSQYVSANVYPAIIENEIAKYSRYKDKQFKNITEDDSVNIANIISSDPRYSELFSLHAALRFIDRFVDFESERTIEQQSKEKLDLLMQAINKAISNGVDIEVYQSKSKRGTIGAKVVIVPDKNTNLAAWKLSGSCPIELTITEHQPNYQHYNKNRNEPLIHTIFFKD